MPTNVTNLGRSGLYDWVMQRATAVILGIYFAVIMGFFICNPDVDYESWNCFFSSVGMKIATIITLLSVAAHAWIGIWTITTDYLIKDGHFGSFSTFFRMTVQGLCLLLIIACVLWGTLIIWGL